jgi:hypothetical protein
VPWNSLEIAGMEELVTEETKNTDWDQVMKGFGLSESRHDPNALMGNQGKVLNKGLTPYIL